MTEHSHAADASAAVLAAKLVLLDVTGADADASEPSCFADEMRAPLSSVCGVLELALRNPEVQMTRAARALQQAWTSAQILTAIVENASASDMQARKARAHVAPAATTAAAVAAAAEPKRAIADATADGGDGGVDDRARDPAALASPLCEPLCDELFTAHEASDVALAVTTYQAQQHGVSKSDTRSSAASKPPRPLPPASAVRQAARVVCRLPSRYSRVK
ncbi:hypothetical protein T492DRAFT_834023 [Pavlovales sp. CCMP2436]|nr:hypothetical protein T492DRAFT_834023 [Pavlovales sp. CCMP2436]